MGERFGCLLLPLLLGGCAATPTAAGGPRLALAPDGSPSGLRVLAHQAEIVEEPAHLQPPAPLPVAPAEVPEPAPDPYPDGGEPPPSPCPQEMALVQERVCVDRWEASLVEVLPDGRERPWSPYQVVDDAPNPLRAVSLPGVVPQGYISGIQAEFACSAAGKRLCAADEWEAACRGPDDTTYPYGEERRRGVCNDGGRAKHPVAEVTQRLGLPADRMWYEGMDHPLINQLEGTLRKSGEQKGCTNAFGVFDMVGNLHEWIDDPEGTFRGGFYLDTKINGEGCDYATTAHGRDYHDYSTGFRCCRDPSPTE